MLNRHPLPLLTQAVAPVPLDRQGVCLLLQDLHAPFSDGKTGRLATLAAAKVLAREFDEYWDAMDLAAPNIARVVARWRSLNLPVVYSCWGYFPPEEPSSLAQTMGWTWDLSGPDGAFPAAWAPQPGDPVFTKPGWGATANPRLLDYLAARAVHTIVLLGALLEFGIRQTCGDLGDRGFHVMVVSDAVPALTALGRAFTTGNMAHGMTKLRSTGETLDLLARLEQTAPVLV